MQILAAVAVVAAIVATACSDASTSEQGTSSTSAPKTSAMVLDPAVQMIIQHPGEFDAPGDRCESDACETLLRLIEGSRHTIDLAVYGMRNQTDLLEALEAAKERGIRVRCVIDRERDGSSYYESTDLLDRRVGPCVDDIDRSAKSTTRYPPTCQDFLYREDARLWIENGERIEDSDAGSLTPCNDLASKPSCRLLVHGEFLGPSQCVAYRVSDKYLVATHASRDYISRPGEPRSDPIMHHKFFVIDGRFLWTGSMNISDSGTGGYNANTVVVVDSAPLASAYVAEFERMYVGGAFHESKDDGFSEQAGSGDRCGFNPPATRVNLEEAEVALWFSPQDCAMKLGVQPIIAQARSRIDVGIFFLTNKHVTADLIAAHERGVQVRVILDATAAGNGYTKHELLRAAGIPVKVEDWGGKMHSKSMAVDGEVLVTGSMNWTAAGDSPNDENTLIIRSDRLARQFHDAFERWWNLVSDKWADLDRRPAPESLDSDGACSDGVDNDFDRKVDLADSGCSANPPPLPALPPHMLIDSLDSNDGYRLYRPLSCDNSGTDWFRCTSADIWRLD